MENNKTEAVIQDDSQDFDNNSKVKKEVSLLNLRHLATNLSNLSIVCISFIFMLIIGQFLTAIAMIVAAVILFVFLITITVFTVGTIYLNSNIGKMWGWFGAISNGSNAFMEVLQNMLISTPYVCGLGILAAVGSIICYSLAKNYKSKARIVVSGIVIGLCLIGMILYFAGVMK